MKQTMSLSEFKDFCGAVEKIIFSTDWNKPNIKSPNIELYTVFDEVYVTPKDSSVTFAGGVGEITIHNVSNVNVTKLPFNDMLVDIFIDSAKGKHICVILVLSKNRC